MKIRRDSLLATIALVFVLQCTVVRSERPKRSESQLKSAASHAITGTVEHVYQRETKTTKNIEYIYGLVEINVKSIEKGVDIEPGDRVFVRYWKQRWIGEGSPDPGHYGHWNVPASGNRVEVFVNGDRKSGYHVLSPNGFFSVKKGLITPTSVGEFELGKTTQEEIFGTGFTSARQRRKEYANQGLYFEFNRGKELTGITVTSPEYQIENGLCVGLAATRIQEVLGIPKSTKIKTEKFQLNALVYDRYTFLLDEDKKVTAIRIGL